MSIDGKSTLFPDRLSWRRVLLFIALLAAAVALIRITGPSDLMDNEQQRQAAYVMDAVQNHHWIIQKDEADEIASKPPLFAWLAGGLMEIFGRCEYPMRIIALVSTLGTMILLVWMSRRFFGNRVALLTALAYLVSAPIARQIWMARMDSLLPFTITCGAFLAWLAWQQGISWFWFWLATAAAVLTKGPIGLIAGAGMGAAFLDNATARWPHRSRGQIIGITLFLLLTAGWFAAAMYEMGPPVYQKLVIQELMKQTVSNNKHRFFGSRFWEPPMYFVHRFTPWSIFACIALWRIIKRAPLVAVENSTTRRARSFIACWLLLGMIPMCMLTHQRADLMLPFYAPGAMLAGLGLSWMVDRLNRYAAIAIVSAMALGVISYLCFEFHIHVSKARQQSEAVATLAGTIRQQAGSDFPLTYVDGPFALNVDLNYMRPLYYAAASRAHGKYDVDRLATYDYSAAADLLSGDDAAFLVVFNADEVRRRMPDQKKPLYDVIEQMLPGAGFLHVLGNRPKLETGEDSALGSGPLKLVAHRVKWVHAWGDDFEVAGAGSLRITNNALASQAVRVRHGDEVLKYELKPGEIWSAVWVK